MEKERFGEWLRRQRKEIGYTIAQAAERLDPPSKEAAWRHVETDLEYVPKRSTIVKYCKALGLDVREGLMVGGYDTGEEFGPGLPVRQLAMYAALPDEAKELVHGLIENVWSWTKKRPQYGTK